ncbi:MAG: hypothetical protein NVS1B11_36100 [Terriglobales bacterium]
MDHEIFFVKESRLAPQAFKVQLLGSPNCEETKQALDHLRNLGVEHEFIDLDEDRAAEQALKT